MKEWAITITISIFLNFYINWRNAKDTADLGKRIKELESVPQYYQGWMRGYDTGKKGSETIQKGNESEQKKFDELLENRSKTTNAIEVK